MLHFTVHLCVLHLTFKSLKAGYDRLLHDAAVDSVKALYWN